MECSFGSMFVPFGFVLPDIISVIYMSTINTERKRVKNKIIFTINESGSVSKIVNKYAHNLNSI